MANIGSWEKIEKTLRKSREKIEIKKKKVDILFDKKIRKPESKIKKKKVFKTNEKDTKN